MPPKLDPNEYVSRHSLLFPSFPLSFFLSFPLSFPLFVLSNHPLHQCFAVMQRIWSSAWWLYLSLWLNWHPKNHAASSVPTQSRRKPRLTWLTQTIVQRDGGSNSFYQSEALPDWCVHNPMDHNRGQDLLAALFHSELCCEATDLLLLLLLLQNCTNLQSAITT